MALTDYQFSFNELDFGLGTLLGVKAVSGLEDFDMAMGDSNLPRAWGDIPGLHTANAREVIFELSTIDDGTLKSALNSFQPSEAVLPLGFKEPSFVERFLYARVVGRVMPRNPSHKFRKVITLRFKIADPRIYSATQEVQVIALYDSGGGGGLEYPEVEYPKEFAGGATGDEIVTNDGNTDAYPVVTFFGPSSGTMTGATLTNLTTGQTADFTFTTGLNPSDIFTADFRRLVQADPGTTPYIRLGGTNRYGDWNLPREPFTIAPGANDLRFEITGTGTDPTCSVTFRDTWL